MTGAAPEAEPVAPLAFGGEPLVAIVAHVRAALAGGATRLRVHVLDPDRGRGRFAGETVEVDGIRWVHRPFRVWVELADRLGLRLLTPRPAPPPRVELVFERLDPAAGWQTDEAAAGDARERYGVGSGFARLDKREDPGLVLDLAEALARVDLAPGARVLDLGVNTGDELALIAALVPERAAGLRFVGVDHSPTAIAAARARFPDPRHRFEVADLADLAGLDLGRFDLVVSIGTLHSPGVDDREVLRRVVQHHLSPTGAVVFGFPNCRYLDGEVQHGTRMKNYREPELGLLIKDVAFYRKYLQQHHRRVHVTGTRYLLVTGISAPGA